MPTWRRARRSGIQGREEHDAATGGVALVPLTAPCHRTVHRRATALVWETGSAGGPCQECKGRIRPPMQSQRNHRDGAARPPQRCIQSGRHCWPACLAWPWGTGGLMGPVRSPRTRRAVTGLVWSRPLRRIRTIWPMAAGPWKPANGGGGEPGASAGRDVPGVPGVRTRPAAGQRRSVLAGRGLLPAGGPGPDLAAVGRPGVAGATQRHQGRRPVRLVLALRGDGGRARSPAGAGDDRDERAAGHQPDGEHLVPAPGHAADPGDAAGQPAGQPHARADAGLRGLGGQLVLGLAPMGRQPGRGGPGRRGLRVLPSAAGLRDRPPEHAVRGAAAVDHRRAAADRHRPRPRRAYWRLAGPAERRSAVHRGRVASSDGPGWPGARYGASGQSSAGRAGPGP